MTCYHELGKLSPEHIKDLTDKCHNQKEWYRAHDKGLRPGDTAYRAVSYTHLTLPTNREV